MMAGLRLQDKSLSAQFEHTIGVTKTVVKFLLNFKKNYKIND